MRQCHIRKYCKYQMLYYLNHVVPKQNNMSTGPRSVTQSRTASGPSSSSPPPYTFHRREQSLVLYISACFIIFIQIKPNKFKGKNKIAKSIYIYIFLQIPIAQTQTEIVGNDGSAAGEVQVLLQQQMAGFCGCNVGTILCGYWVLVWEHITGDKELYGLQSEADC